MTDLDPAPRAFYSEPGRMTAVGRHAPQIDKLPHDVGELAAVAQGLLIHEHMAQAYGVTLTDADRSSVHVRPADQLLDLIVARDDRPLDAPRPPATRLPGNCRHFSVLMVAMLRAQGTPVGAGAASVLTSSRAAFEDHWVCEYWNSEQERWILVDAQIDAGQRAYFPIDFDVTDVPRDVSSSRATLGSDTERATPTRTGSASAWSRSSAPGGSPGTSCETSRRCATSSCFRGTSGATCPDRRTRSRRPSTRASTVSLR